MKKIGLFYAPAKGSTEKVAKRVAAEFGKENVELVLVNDQSSPEQLAAYDHLIFGISTVGRDSWDSNYGKIGWDHFLPKLATYSFAGKTVAIFGLGNHIMYEDNFLDALGMLGPIVIKNGGKLVGAIKTNHYEEYENIESNGVINGEFPGLPIDEDNLPDKTDERVQEWVKSIKHAFGF